MGSNPTVGSSAHMGALLLVWEVIHMTSAFAEKVLRFIEEYKMIKPGERILVAVSGGKDSMALLHFLSENAVSLKCELVAANLDHGLRGSEGQLEAKMIRAFCEKRKIPFYHKMADVRKFMLENRGLSPEEAARLKRLEFLNSAKTFFKADKVAIAHHLDDLAETILMRLIRGTGLKGLLGMKPVDGFIIRPFLSTTVHDIKDYVTINMIPFSSDKTNVIEDFDRNFIRHRITPLLRQLNPAYERAFWRFFLNTLEDYGFLEKNVAELMKLTLWINGQALVEKEALISREWPVVAEYLRTVVQRLSRKGYPPTRERIMALKKLLRSPRNGWTIQFSDGVDCVSKGKYIIFHNELFSTSSWSKKIETFPSSIEMESGKVWIDIVKDIPESMDGSDIAVCPISVVRMPLLLRKALESDKFVPFGLHSSKSVISLAAHEAPPDVFLNLMVLEDSKGRILWIPGVRVSEHCRFCGEENEFLLFRFERRSTRGT